MKILLYGFLCILSILTIFSYNTKCEDFNRDVLEINGILTDNTPIRVVIRRTLLTSKYPYQDAYMWGGDVSVLPKKVVSDMKITISSRKLIVPLSAYCDLGNPEKIVIDIKRHGFILIISGGQTATAYTAKLVFNLENIASRIVYLGEFPDEAREKTIYSFPTEDN